MSAPYSREQVAFAARAWTMRAEEERQSAAVFSDLLALLADADVALEVVREVHRTVGDELRHVRLCARMARLFGAPEPATRPLARPGPPAIGAGARRARALQIVLVEGAMGETISSALFAAGRRASQEPRVRAALGRILRDEALHARRFWRLLDVLRRPEDAAELHRVAARALGLIEQAQMVPAMRRLSEGASFDPAWAELGVLRPESRVDAFYGAVEKRVLPALTARGLDGRGAWASRYGAQVPPSETQTVQGA